MIKGKIINISTEHTGPFRQLFEGLKDTLTDVNIEFIRPPIKVIHDNKNKLNKDNNKKINYDDDDDDDNTINMNNSSNSENSNKESKNQKKVITKQKDDIKIQKNKDKDKDKKQKKKKVDDIIEDIESENNVIDNINSKNDNNQIDKNENIKDGGIKITVLDNTKTLFIYVKLDAKEFSEFYCKPPTYDIGINLGLFHKLISALDRDDILRLSINEDDRQNLILDVKNTEKNYDSQYKLKLMDVNKNDYSVPSIEFHAQIKFDTFTFHKLCREKSKIAEHLEIKCTRNTLTFSWKGDSSLGSTNFHNNDNGISILFRKDAPEIIQGIFELKYLVLFTKYSTLCPEVIINMKNNFPLIITYKIATLGVMNLCLTPIIEDNILNNFSDEEENNISS